PGTRYSFSRWKDQHGNFWIYGGGNSGFNDMWMYNPNTNLWTWMAGAGPVALTPFSQYCTPGNKVPPVSSENRVCYTDSCGRFWHFGGTNSNTGCVNTLWMFDPVTLKFTWVSGSQNPIDPGSPGVMGVPSPSNMPRALHGQNGFTSSNGDFWVVSGRVISNGVFFNTLWRYQVDYSCPGNLISASIEIDSSSSFCLPAAVFFSVEDSSSAFNIINIQWDFGDSTLSSDTSSVSSPSWTYTQPGTYTVSAIVRGTNSCTSVTDTLITTVTIFDVPVIDLGNDTVLCSSLVSFPLTASNTGMNYQWSTGATTQTITATAAGSYAVLVTSDPAGQCTDRDTINISIATQPDPGSDTIICSGQTITINPGIAGAYQWNTGDTSATL
ncbi:MAG: PKD domain-containing protein, partial [Bacteroidia bacterium]